jgi:hypothetical protein
MIDPSDNTVFDVINHKTVTEFAGTIAFSFIATMGGIARYLNGYTNGVPFKLSIFCASAFVAGFSGLMFAYLGEAMSMPKVMLFVMSGVGGFFGEQTMKLILEKVNKKL